jgi:hypothetical protein
MFLFCYILTFTLFLVNIDLKKTFRKTWWSSDCRKIAAGGFFQNLQNFADFVDFCGFFGFLRVMRILADFGGFCRILADFG